MNLIVGGIGYSNRPPSVYRECEPVTILVFTPTIGDGPRPEMMQSVSQQTFTDYVHEVSWHNPFPGEKKKNVVAQYQRAQQMCLDGGYDALLTFESDMTMEPDAIQKLYDTDALVVFGVCVLRHGIPTLNAWQFINNKNLGMSLSLYPKEVRKARARGWCEVSGVGWGCTLIRREVLERLTIHANSEEDAGDLTFATDCLRAGIKMIARFDVPCGHYHEDGTLLMPFKNGGIVNRVLARTTFNALIDGQSMPMKEGRYYSIPVPDAVSLQRAGYVNITNEDDSQEEAGEREQPDIGERELAVDPKARGRTTRAKKAK